MMGQAAKRLVQALLCSLFVGVLAMPASAGPATDDAARDAAKEIAVQAIEAMNEKRYADALEFLRRAEQKFHAPTHLLLMARCHAELGQHVEAHEAYGSLLVEQVPNYAPDAFHKAQAAARSEIEQLSSKVARVRISATSSGGAPVTVYVDGKEVASRRLAMPIALAPGSHRIEATAPGATPAVENVTPAIGSLLEVKLEVGAPAGSGAVPTAGEPAETATAGEGGSVPIGPVALMVVGGAALAAGTVLGIVTSVKTSSIKEDCVDDICPLEREDEADSAKLTGHLSTAMFIAGGVAAVAGLTWLAVDLSGSDGADEAAALQVRVGPTGAILEGTF